MKLAGSPSTGSYSEGCGTFVSSEANARKAFLASLRASVIKYKMIIFSSKLSPSKSKASSKGKYIKIPVHYIITKRIRIST